MHNKDDDFNIGLIIIAIVISSFIIFGITSKNTPVLKYENMTEKDKFLQNINSRKPMTLVTGMKAGFETSLSYR